MQRRPSAAVAPLTSNSHILHRKRSSLLSSASLPRTPTTQNAPLPLFTSTNTNRYSTDSWNSSNYDGDDLEWEWKSEQLRLLARTLDALPAHLLTPFNGPVPPSNLLDKIARGVAQAKGPLEWPHSLRATRAKIVELARVRARAVSDGTASDTIAEEESTGSDVPLQQTTNTGTQRPLYRQSSMDFMQAAKLDSKDNVNLRRLSHRLQTTDRMLSSPYPPYAYPDRPSTPSSRASGRALPSLNPSTPSSTTLNSTISSPRQSMYRRSISSLSSSSDAYSLPAVNPRLQRVKRADTFSGPSAFNPGNPLKRAPSFGGHSNKRGAESVAMSIDFNARDSDNTSDEEEKLRDQKAKKARTKSVAPIAPALASPIKSPIKSASRAKAKSTSSSKTSKVSPTAQNTKAGIVRTPPRLRASLQRNPSIFGPELPNPQPTLEPPASICPPTITHHTPATLPRSPSGNSNVGSPYNLTNIPRMTPNVTSPRSLRRTKGLSSLPRLATVPARRISFGSIGAPEDDSAACGAGLGLGSAFQLN